MLLFKKLCNWYFCIVAFQNIPSEYTESQPLNPGIKIQHLQNANRRRWYIMSKYATLYSRKKKKHFQSCHIQKNIKYIGSLTFGNKVTDFWIQRCISKSTCQFLGIINIFQWLATLAYIWPYNCILGCTFIISFFAKLSYRIFWMQIVIMSSGFICIQSSYSGILQSSLL